MASDSEQLTDRSENDLDDADSASEKAGEDGSEDSGWGASKRDYYDADVIETEQDALDEEKEALRIQRKQLEGMTEADFAFDENEWRDTTKAGSGDADGAGEDVVTEVLPQLQITDDMGPAERKKLLRARYPEFEPLAEEFVALTGLFRDVAAAAKRSEDGKTVGEHGDTKTETEGFAIRPVTSAAVVKYQALTAYLGALAMYFAFFTSPAGRGAEGSMPLPPGELRDHPVMDCLVKTRALWQRVKDIKVQETQADAVKRQPSVSVEQQSDTLRKQEPSVTPNSHPTERSQRKKKKSKTERAAAAAKAESDARRAEELRKMEEELAELSTLLEKRKTGKPRPAEPASKAVPAVHDDNSDIGEETELTAQEAAEKARRRKSLRFYTSQITQKASKRGTAGRDAGGDADIPYRERLKDRQARLNAEAQKRGRARKATDDLGGESDEEDRRVAREVRGDGAEDDGEEGYYDMIAARTQQRKTDKQARAEAHAQAAQQGGQVTQVEEVGADGKRAITYAISKNKGLTPHRRKEVRNPRVKKRMKFEEKKKKLGSVRPVYRGGEGKGGYRGELTGIKSGVIKSVKL